MLPLIKGTFTVILEISKLKKITAEQSRTQNKFSGGGCILKPCLAAECKFVMLRTCYTESQQPDDTSSVMLGR